MRGHFFIHSIYCVLFSTPWKAASKTGDWPVLQSTEHHICSSVQKTATSIKYSLSFTIKSFVPFSYPCCFMWHSGGKLWISYASSFGSQLQTLYFHMVVFPEKELLPVLRASVYGEKGLQLTWQHGCLLGLKWPGNGQPRLKFWLMKCKSGMLG